MSEESAVFVAKWAERDPAFRLVLLFAPRAAAEGVGLWFALLREIEDAALDRSAPEIGAAKLGFYRREFAGATAAAHPLVRAWRQRAAGPCGERLAAAAARLAELASVPSAEALAAAIGSWAEAAAEAAEALFGERLAPFPIAADFLLRRLAALPAEAARGRLWLPLDVLAAEGLDRVSLASRATLADPRLSRARAALARWWLERIEPGGGPVGAVYAALARFALERLARRDPARWPALRALWVAWRAARAARARAGGRGW